MPSRYELVNVVAHRARKIAAEAERPASPWTRSRSASPSRRWPTASWRPPRTRRTSTEEARLRPQKQAKGTPALAFLVIKRRREDRDGAHVAKVAVAKAIYAIDKPYDYLDPPGAGEGAGARNAGAGALRRRKPGDGRHCPVHLEQARGRVAPL
ncbi:MAG: DNA-directed RNA polymerase subunit omega [Lawsonibacter sp.]